jgi:hypothetical protein
VSPVLGSRSTVGLASEATDSKLAPTSLPVQEPVVYEPEHSQIFEFAPTY